MTTQLVLASNNLHKLEELQALFAPLNVQLIRQSDLHIMEAEEPHATFVENALAKARNAAAASGMPAIADDSGLCVHALGGAPGVHSAYYAAMATGQRSDAANNQHLLNKLEGETERAAHLYCCLVAVKTANDPAPLISEGRLFGDILKSPQGSNGFGYAPLLFLRDRQCSLAQLSDAEKNAISHRSRAAHAMLELMRAVWSV
jgi:XTP/dITP diphosphohydrolase